jgi:hypothetical protein
MGKGGAGMKLGILQDNLVAWDGRRYHEVGFSAGLTG